VCFEIRNVLVESARIARGNIEALSKLNVSQFDAVVFPGGFGAAKNLYAWLVGDLLVLQALRLFHCICKQMFASEMAVIVGNAHMQYLQNYGHVDI
jgi:enhancing lycopene biosynthesis protein 2